MAPVGEPELCYLRPVLYQHTETVQSKPEPVFFCFVIFSPRGGTKMPRSCLSRSSHRSCSRGRQGHAGTRRHLQSKPAKPKRTPGEPREGLRRGGSGTSPRALLQPASLLLKSLDSRCCCTTSLPWLFGPFLQLRAPDLPSVVVFDHGREEGDRGAWGCAGRWGSPGASPLGAGRPLPILVSLLRVSEGRDPRCGRQELRGGGRCSAAGSGCCNKPCSFGPGQGSGPTGGDVQLQCFLSKGKKNKTLL